MTNESTLSPELKSKLEESHQIMVDGVRQMVSTQSRAVDDNDSPEEVELMDRWSNQDQMEKDLDEYLI